MTEPANRVVYDCNVFVQALINQNGPAGRCVTVALEKRVALFVSEALLAEVRKAPAKRTPARLGVTPERVELLVKNLLKAATLVAVVPAVFDYRRDPDDAHYINLALAAQAKLVVSRDRDLLDLMDEQTKEGIVFRQRFPQIQILDPVQFIRQLDAAG